MQGTIWKLRIPVANSFARLLTPYRPPKEPDLLCPACRKTVWKEPLVAEWEEGCDLIGDFIFAGARIVTQKAIAGELLKQFCGFKQGALEFPDHVNLHEPTQKNRRPIKRVWFPYKGPPLCEVFITCEVPLLKQSTVHVNSKCEQCGRIVYQSFEGLEEKTARRRVKRQKGKGLFIRQEDLKGCDFFRPEYTGLTLCTDSAKRFMESKSYSNIEFLEAGDIISD